MTRDTKYVTEDFMLERVMKRPPRFIYLVAAAGFLTAGLLYLFIIRPLFHHGGLALAFGLMLLIMMLLLNTQASTVKLRLDEKSLFIDGKRYLKNDIAAIYTYDYKQRDRSKVFFRIALNNGKNIYLSDTDLFERTDKARALTLRRLFAAINKRLKTPDIVT